MALPGLSLLRKFERGRKEEFGLNGQAVCDAEGKMQDTSILHPGSTSDPLIALHLRECPVPEVGSGHFDPGLCLFGDNAYMKTPFMATPDTALSNGTKDAYSLYHFQLQIQI